MCSTPTTPATVQRAYKYRCYPTADQRQLLNRYFGAARWTWNRSLEYRTKAYRRRGESRSGVDFSRLLTALKRTRAFSWLKETPATVLTQRLRDQDAAYRNFFAKRARFPRFRKRSHGDAIRFQLDQRTVMNCWRPDQQLLKLPGLGALKLRWSRLPNGGVPKMVTVRRDAAGRYFITFMVEEPVIPLPPTSKVTGIDLGLKDHVCGPTEGEVIANPRHLKARQRRLKRAQRVLSRRTKGSRRWHAQRRRVARLHAKVADARSNYLHQVSHQLIHENQVICTETLNIRGMAKNRCLAQAVHDAAWGELIRQLTYKAQWYGREVIQVDPWFPSSKRCSACGELNQQLKLKHRQWTCSHCGAQHHRDHNAARNILAEGLRIRGDRIEQSTTPGSGEGHARGGWTTPGGIAQ